MRRRLRSAKHNRKKVFITQYSRVRKALARPIASCPDPPTSTVYSSSGSNSVNLVGFIKVIELPKYPVNRRVRRLSGTPSRKDGYWRNWMTSTHPIPVDSPACRSMTYGPMSLTPSLVAFPLTALLYTQKKERMRKIYKGWKVLKVQTGLGYDSEADRVVCSDEAWSIHYAGISVTRAFAIRSCSTTCSIKRTRLVHTIMDQLRWGTGSNPSVDYDFNFANSETHSFLEEDVTPTAGGRQVDTRQGPDAAGPSRRSGNLGKRKQRDATEAMAYEAMEEVRDYFRGISQTGGGSEQSVQNGGLVQCMNLMQGMGYSSHHQMMMWHYFDSHQHLMGPFCQINDNLRREIIGSVINP
ncbi:hypothetical protein TIFTF001_014120 [Ficus carica]|uniref:Myb/SANT-like domain-containing protein n=1 Tax=Ficus carica TaxID=3494 RepID=A0AA88A4R1_FICCA|nr:hypothetical protein TIFTF001_014120 [Ficus carica]